VILLFFVQRQIPPVNQDRARCRVVSMLGPVGHPAHRRPRARADLRNREYSGISRAMPETTARSGLVTCR